MDFGEAVGFHSFFVSYFVLHNRFIDTTVFGDGLVVDIFSIGHVLAWCGRHAKEADVVHLGSFEG